MTDLLDNDPLRARLKKLEEQAELGGGADRIAKQHKDGKLTARERIDLLLDPGTFIELDKFVTHRCHDFGMADKKIPGDGVVTGYGTIDGRQVFVFAQDFTVFGGSLSGAYAQKICKVMDLADPRGRARSSGSTTPAARASRKASSRSPATPTSSCATRWPRAWCRSSPLILGPCAGGAVYSPAITDFILMAKSSSYMFITGPDVIKTVTHEEVTKEDLGGATAHNQKSGVAHFAAENEQAAIAHDARAALVPARRNNAEDAPSAPSDDPVDRAEAALATLVPSNPNKPYDIRDVIKLVVDDERFFEVQEHYAKNIVIGFARLGGKLGGHRGQPAGGARRLPRHRRLGEGRALRALLRLLQHPAGDLRRRARLPARHRAGVRRHHQARRQAALRLRRGHRAQGHGDHPQGLRRRLRRHGQQAHPRRRELRLPHRGDRGDGPRGRGQHHLPQGDRGRGDQKAEKDRLVADYREKFANPYKAAELGYIDEVIRPEQTRLKLIRALEMLKDKRQENLPRKHGNIPL